MKCKWVFGILAAVAVAVSSGCGGTEVVEVQVEEETVPVDVSVAGVESIEERDELVSNIRVTALMILGSEHIARINEEVVRKGDFFDVEVGDKIYRVEVLNIQGEKIDIAVDKTAINAAGGDPAGADF